jgi:hypothetical protein
MTTRDECKTLIARQIAIHEGRNWTRLPEKNRIDYLTLAGNILATVERNISAYTWRETE